MEFKLTKRKEIEIIRIVITAIAVFGIIWFFLPITKGGYNSGSIFGQFIGLVTIFLANFYGKFKRKGIKVFMNIFLVVFILGLCWLTFLTAKINMAQTKVDIPQNATIIVLGARVYDHGPSVSLKNRLDVAYNYLTENPESKCIVTGGQGADEPRTEAAVEKEYLVGLGIAENRILQEDKSTSTEENMRNSAEISKVNNLGTNLVIATQGFHQYRSSCLAVKFGFTPYAAVAYTNPLLYPAYYGRELLSLTKYYIETLLGK